MRNKLQEIFKKHDADVDTFDLVNYGHTWFKQTVKECNKMLSDVHVKLSFKDNTIEFKDAGTNWTLCKVSFDDLEDVGYAINFKKDNKVVASIYFELLEDY